MVENRFEKEKNLKHHSVVSKHDILILNRNKLLYGPIEEKNVLLYNKSIYLLKKTIYILYHV